MENNKKIKYKWPLIGNKKNIDFLSRSLSNDKLVGSYIFHGPDNMGKTRLAEHFAQIILCQKKEGFYSEKPCGECSSCKKFILSRKEINDLREQDENLAHNDFYVVKKDKEKKNISVEQIRDLIYSLGMSSFSDSYKIGIIKHADQLSESAANALLKLLEEPRKKVIIILVTSNIERILKTIVSRCQIMEFGPVEIEEINKYLLDNYKITRSAAKNYSRISLGRPALALKFIEDKDFYNNYLSRINSLLDLIEAGDINQRLSLVGNMIDKKLENYEAIAVLKRLLEILQGLYRDMYLISFGLNDLVQNEIVDLRLKKIATRENLNKIVSLLDEIEKSEEYISSNISSKLILENITLSI